MKTDRVSFLSDREIGSLYFIEILVTIQHCQAVFFLLYYKQTINNIQQAIHRSIDNTHTQTKKTTTKCLKGQEKKKRGKK